MVNLEYVKRIRRKKIAAIVSASATGVVGIFILIAFLGQRLGSFTIGINNYEGVNVGIDLKDDFGNPTTYLRVNQLPALDMYTNSLLESKVDQIDSESTDYLYGAKYDKKTNKAKFLSFFKYTFFVKNTCDIPVKYNFDLNIVQNNRPSNVAYDLTDILRVRIYENKNEEHNSNVYAKKSVTGHENADGTYTYEEAISYGQKDPEFCGYAEMFKNDKCITTREVRNFMPDEIIRYTVLFWLEGEDPQAAQTYPNKCSIKLGVEIAAYEND